MYGAIAALGIQHQRFGNYFDFFWQARRTADVRVRLGYRQENLHAFVQAREVSYPRARGHYKTEFAIIGDDFFDDGQVISWRATLIVDLAGLWPRDDRIFGNKPARRADAIHPHSLVSRRDIQRPVPPFASEGVRAVPGAPRTRTDRLTVSGEILSLVSRAVLGLESASTVPSYGTHSGRGSSSIAAA